MSAEPSAEQRFGQLVAALAAGDDEVVARLLAEDPRLALHRLAAQWVALTFEVRWVRLLRSLDDALHRITLIPYQLELQEELSLEEAEAGRQALAREVWSMYAAVQAWCRSIQVQPEHYIQVMAPDILDDLRHYRAIILDDPTITPDPDLQEAVAANLRETWSSMLDAFMRLTGESPRS